MDFKNCTPNSSLLTFSTNIYVHVVILFTILSFLFICKSFIQLVIINCNKSKPAVRCCIGVVTGKQLVNQGSHFFHNITSFNVGYFTIDSSLGNAFIDWEWLRSQPSKEETGLVRHIRLAKPVVVKLNGHQSKGVIPLDGRMVERMHADMGRRVLAIAAAIAARG